MQLVRAGSELASARLRVLPGWVSILPSLVAIAAALLLRSVVPALLLGVWLGAWAIHGMSLSGLLVSLLQVFEVWVLETLTDRDHMSIVLFSLMIGGMVGLVTRNGGMHGVVERLRGFASDRRRTQIATAGMGLAIFFDDYANTLVVGNSMRPVTDRVRVSREKLAFLVDATAAPIASVAIVTSWIGYEVGLLRDAIAAIDGLDESAYLVFLRSLAYSFYPWLMLLFVFLVGWTGRDFGAMAKAERRAAETGAVVDPSSSTETVGSEASAVVVKEGIPHRPLNAALPVATLIGGVMVGLWVTGEGDTLQAIIVGSADSYRALMWGSIDLGARWRSRMTLVPATSSASSETIDGLVLGPASESTFLAMIVLVLAWSLGNVADRRSTPPTSSSPSSATRLPASGGAGPRLPTRRRRPPSPPARAGARWASCCR